MTKLKPGEEKGFQGICMSCKKKKFLHEFSGLKLCEVCELIFFEPLEKLYQGNEYGRDIVNDEKNKKGDE